MRLRHQYVCLVAIPPSGPVLVGPIDAERKIDPSISQQVVERRLKQAPAMKPIMVEAEPFDPVAASKVRLSA
jgi:hypothetical protein